MFICLPLVPWLPSNKTKLNLLTLSSLSFYSVTAPLRLNQYKWVISVLLHITTFVLNAGVLTYSRDTQRKEMYSLDEEKIECTLDKRKIWFLARQKSREWCVFILRSCLLLLNNNTLGLWFHLCRYNEAKVWLDFCKSIHLYFLWNCLW